MSDEEVLSFGDELFEFVSSSTPQQVDQAAPVTDEDEPVAAVAVRRQVGTRVLVNWIGKQYSAVVQKRHATGSYDVVFEIDGSKGTNVNPLSHGLELLPPKKAGGRRKKKLDANKLFFGEVETTLHISDEPVGGDHLKRKRGRPRGSKNRLRGPSPSAQKSRGSMPRAASARTPTASDFARSAYSTASEFVPAANHPSPSDSLALSDGASPSLATKAALEARPGIAGRFRAVCMTYGCNAFAKKDHMCVAHGPRCAHPGCNTGINARGLCATHKRMYEKAGTLPPRRRTKQKIMKMRLPPPPPPRTNMVRVTSLPGVFGTPLSLPLFSPCFTAVRQLRRATGAKSRSRVCASGGGEKENKKQNKKQHINYINYRNPDPQCHTPLTVRLLPTVPSIWRFPRCRPFSQDWRCTDQSCAVSEAAKQVCLMLHKPPAPKQHSAPAGCVASTHAAATSATAAAKLPTFTSSASDPFPADADAAVGVAPCPLTAAAAAAVTAATALASRHSALPTSDSDVRGAGDGGGGSGGPPAAASAPAPAPRASVLGGGGGRVWTAKENEDFFDGLKE